MRPIIFSAVIALFGCNAQVQHGLDERQANEIQAVLQERGVEAKKVPEGGKKPSWAIQVDEDRSAEAIRLLAELGLPRPKTEGFGDIFGKGSLVPTPTEERALFIEALSGEVARTLESVEGVTAARVHLVLPPVSRPGVPPIAAKASAFLRVRSGSLDRLAQSRAELRALIAGAVEGLTPENVTVVLNEVATSQPVLTPPSRVAGLRLLVAGLGVTVSLLALAMVLLTLRLRHFRAKAAVRPPSSAVKSSVSTNLPRKAA